MPTFFRVEGDPANNYSTEQAAVAAATDALSSANDSLAKTLGILQVVVTRIGTVTLPAPVYTKGA